MLNQHEKPETFSIGRLVRPASRWAVGSGVDDEEMDMMRIVRVLAASMLALASWTSHAQTQPWPNRPLRVVVPVEAGSTTDIVARVVVAQLATQLGQSVIVENHPGAGTTIGAGLVARAEPDGYTLLFNSSAQAIAPALYRNLSFDTARDFSAIAPVGLSPNVLVVSPSSGWRTVADLVAAAKTRSGGLSFSSVGIGTATHLSAERFLFSAGISATHVPFNGGAQAMSEVLAGRIDFFFGPIGLVLPNVRGGKLVALAASSTQRAAGLPDVPTTLEAGFVNAEYPIWFGLFAPVKTPRDVIDELNREMLAALRSPGLHETLRSLGVDPMAMTPSEFDSYVRKEIGTNAELVKAAGVKLD
jgi:tripartite-type tricarboxylate transporter receptor subunit TctC